MPQAPIPNPLTAEEPPLAQRLSALRDHVHFLLFGQLAAQVLKEPAFRGNPRPPPFEEVRAVALALGVLTKPSWDADDLRVIDACWRTASRTDFFADEFEAERHRIQ